jgi:hypothetical protein
MAFDDDDFNFGLPDEEFRFDFDSGRFIKEEDRFDFRPGKFQIGNDFDFRLGKFQIGGLFEELSAKSDIRNFDTGLLEELFKGADLRNFDKSIRWSYRGDEERSKELTQLAAKTLLRHFLNFKDGTHLGYGRRIETHRGRVRVDDYTEDGRFISQSVEERDGAIQIETIFSPSATDVNIWTMPPIRRVTVQGGEKSPCREKDYIWIGQRMKGDSQDAFGNLTNKAQMHVWEPWPENADQPSLNFVTNNPDGGDLLSYDDWSDLPECPVSSDPWVNYTGWRYRFAWQRCLGRKTGDDYVPEGLHPGTTEYIFTNFMFETGLPETYEEIWGDQSRPESMWHGGAPTVNWNGGTVVVSRFGGYFCGPGRAHDPDTDEQCWFESYHCDPEDPPKRFTYMHKYPDEKMGWGYEENNVGPPLWEDYPTNTWNVRGTVQPGRYIVKVSVERSKCETTSALSVELMVKLGKLGVIEDEVKPKCLAVTQNIEFSSPPGSYLFREYLPYGYNVFQADGWRFGSYEDRYYPESLEYGPPVHGADSWWQGYLSIDAQNRVIERHESTPPTLLMELGFDLGATPPPEDPNCCTSSIPKPVPDNQAKPFPNPTGGENCPVYIPAYLYHSYYVYFYATVISATSEGKPCLIQITSQSSYGCSCEPYGYGFVFQATGYARGEEIEYDNGVIQPPEGGDYSAGDAVIIVNTVIASAKKVVRHVDDPWFAANPDQWIREEWRADKVCPDGLTHEEILEEMGICDNLEC